MRRKQIKVIALFLSVVLISLCLAPVAFANIISDARQSILRVLAGYSTGTAFVIAQSEGTTYLVTNVHVIEDDPENVYIIPDNIRGNWIPASVIYLQDGLDLAILITDEGLSDRPVLPLCRVENITAADTIYALGFPGAADEVVDDPHSLPSGTNDVTVTNGIVGKVEVVMDDGIRAIQSNVSITFGNSGGPMLNERAEVVGVNTWGYSEGAYALSYSIHIDYIIDEAIARGIPYVSAAAPTAEPTATPTVEPTATPTPESTDAPTDAPTEATALEPAVTAADEPITAPTGSLSVQDSSQDGMILAVLLGIVVIVGVIVIVVAVTRNKGPRSASRQLHCMKGRLAGRTFILHDKLVIGRDAQQCQVVYPPDTKGVSSVHCEVFLRQGVIYLMDKGSSFGTFLTGGQRLLPNQPVMLQSGNIFYLAEPLNEFRVL